jgi:hypothetical protein
MRIHLGAPTTTEHKVKLPAIADLRSQHRRELPRCSQGKIHADFPGCRHIREARSSAANAPDAAFCAFEWLKDGVWPGEEVVVEDDFDFGA